MARGHAYKANPPQESQVEWKLEDNLGTQPSIHSWQNLNQARLLLGDLVFPVTFAFNQIYADSQLFYLLSNIFLYHIRLHDLQTFGSTFFVNISWEHFIILIYST